jgi:hypothetical protein
VLANILPIAEASGVLQTRDLAPVGSGPLDF